MSTRTKSELKVIEEETPACRVCGSTSFIRQGKNLDLQNGLLSQQYRCKKCGTAFTAGKGKHMKTPDYVVRLCVALAKKGLYLYDVADVVTNATGVHVNTNTVGVWLKKYVPGYKPKLGVKADPRNKGKKYTYNRRGILVGRRTVKGMQRQLRAMADKLEKIERGAKPR